MATSRFQVARDRSSSPACRVRGCAPGRFIGTCRQRHRFRWTDHGCPVMKPARQYAGRSSGVNPARGVIDGAWQTGGPGGRALRREVPWFRNGLQRHVRSRRSATPSVPSPRPSCCWARWPTTAACHWLTPPRRPVSPRAAPIACWRRWKPPGSPSVCPRAVTARVPGPSAGRPSCWASWTCAPSPSRRCDACATRPARRSTWRVLRDTSLIYVEILASRSPLRMADVPGASALIHATALGKSIAIHLDPARLGPAAGSGAVPGADPGHSDDVERARRASRRRPPGAATHSTSRRPPPGSRAWRCGDPGGHAGRRRHLGVSPSGADGRRPHDPGRGTPRCRGRQERQRPTLGSGRAEHEVRRDASVIGGEQRRVMRGSPIERECRGRHRCAVPRTQR